MRTWDYLISLLLEGYTMPVALMTLIYVKSSSTGYKKFLRPSSNQGIAYTSRGFSESSDC